MLMKLGLRQRRSDRKKGLMASGCSRAAPLIHHSIKLDGRGSSLMDSEVDAGDISDILGLLICCEVRVTLKA